MSRSTPSRDATAVVTGAGGGIGSGLAIRAAQEGFDVAICDLDATALARTADQVTGYGVQCTSAAFDIRDEAEVRRFADGVTGDIGLLFPNAGVLREGPLSAMTMDSLRLTIDVNLVAVLSTVYAFLPRMLEQTRRSRIVFTGSLASYWTAPSIAIYCATKQAVRAISDSFRAQFAEDGSPIDVSLLAPGAVQTGILRYAAARDTPGEAAVPTDRVDEGGLTPAEVADIVFRAIAEDRYLIATHREVLDGLIASEHEGVLADLRP